MRDLSALLGAAPAEGSTELVLAPADWSRPADDQSGADVLLWGAPALPAGTDLARASRSAALQARTLAGLHRRPPHGRAVRAVHALDPPALHLGPRAELRRALLRGVLVELVRPPAPRRTIDGVLEVAGATGPLGPVRLGSGGTLLTPVRVSRGAGILRAAPRGAPGDPTRVADALDAMSAQTQVPSLYGAGVHTGVSWTVEGRLDGIRPRVLDKALAAQVAGFCARLPLSGRAASSRQDVDVLAGAFPEHARQLEELSRDLDGRLSTLPGVARHGDLWTGNLLQSGHRLTAVLDWDAWSVDGVPGTDLLHLFGTQQRLAQRQAIGEVLLERPWERNAFQDAAQHYRRGMDVEMSPSRDAAVGVAWWAAQIASDITRSPELVVDARWRERNVGLVLAAHTAGRPPFA